MTEQPLASGKRDWERINAFLWEYWPQVVNSKIIDVLIIINYTVNHCYVITLCLRKRAFKQTCRNTVVVKKMKKILFGCIGAGLAFGGAYFLFKKWQKHKQRCQEKNNEVYNT